MMSDCRFAMRCLQLILLVQVSSYAYKPIICPNHFQKGCVIQLNRLQCNCSSFELCPDDPYLFNDRNQCEERLRNSQPHDCGRLKYWGCQVVRQDMTRTCLCHNRTACIGFYEHDTMADCEAELKRDYNIPSYAVRKCRLDNLFQSSRPVRCGKARKFCTPHGCRNCCHSWSGCNPNPFLYTTTDRCHLGLQSELFHNPCIAVTCKTGFMCTTDASLCSYGSPCTKLEPVKPKQKFYCVIDPSVNPCKDHVCRVGWKCQSSLDQRCHKPPCAASAVCRIDPMYNPCKHTRCHPDEYCQAEDGTMCSNGVCVKVAHCYPDPKAASPKVNLVSSAFGPLVVAGSNITLSCTTVAYPHPTSLTFYHNGEAISETTDGVDLHQWKSGNATTLYGQLVINNSSVSHSGTYTCTAVNYVEEVSEQTEMFVYECPTCDEASLDTHLCSLNLDTAVIGKAVRSTAVVAEDPSWTSYEFSISRVFNRFTTANATYLRHNKNVNFVTKSSACQCQAMDMDRPYLVLFKLEESGGDAISLFPHGRVYLWQTVKHIVQDDKDRRSCKEQSSQTTNS